MTSFASGLAQGFAQGFRPRGSQGGVTEYQQARLAQQQEQLNSTLATQQTQQDLNSARLTEQTLENQQAKAEQQFQNNVMQKASEGGFNAAIDYGLKSGHYEWANARLKEQQDLNNSIARGMKISADADSSQIHAYNERLKALGGVSAVFYKDVNGGANPAETYKKYQPIIQQLWPDAPKEYTPQVDSIMKVAISQSLTQNAAYTRMTTTGKLLSERAAAMQAGDGESVRYYDAALSKQAMVTNPQTGEWLNLLGEGPDDHMGSVDAKANAVGLAAGSAPSSMIPSSAAIFHQQPMNNVMDKRYKDYSRENGITSQDRTLRNMKASPGYNMVIHPDGSNEMVAIPKVGGKAINNESESVRIAFLQRAQKTFNDYSDLMVDASTGDVRPEALGLLGTISLSQLSGGSSNSIVNTAINHMLPTKAQLLANYGRVMVEGIMRGLTGAAMNMTERPFLEQELLPQSGDKAETLLVKRDLVHEILNGSLDIIKYGVDGKPVTNGNGELELDRNMITKLKEYATHGGSVLDVTKGDGADPEKARLTMLKKLSYDPKQVQLLMHKENNGQGVDFTEEQAKNFIDGANKARAAGKKVVLPGDPPQQQPRQGGQ